jgi:hypothetical protein
MDAIVEAFVGLGWVGDGWSELEGAGDDGMMGYCTVAQQWKWRQICGGFG